MKFKWSPPPAWFCFIASLSLVISCISSSDVNTERAGGDDDFSDYWLIKVNGNLDEVKQLAAEHKFTILKQVGSLDGYYHVKLDSANASSSSNSMRRRRSNDEASSSKIKNAESLINSHPSVEMFEREKVLRRSKRDYIEDPASVGIPIASLARRHSKRASLVGVSSETNLYYSLSDPFWDKMWYLNRNTVFRQDAPDMNVTGAWELGYSGRGASVTFLDDGLEWDHPDIQQNYVRHLLFGREFMGDYN